MSVAFTEQAVIERRKTVTRRKGWLFVKPGDRLTLCRKVMGRKPGEPLVRICEVEVVSVIRCPLRMVRAPGELTKEGFPAARMDDLSGGIPLAAAITARAAAKRLTRWADELTDETGEQ